MSDAILAKSWPEVWHRARQHEATHYNCSHGKVQSRPVQDDPNQIDTPTTLTADDPIRIRFCREKKEDHGRWTWSASAPN